MKKCPLCENEGARIEGLENFYDVECVVCGEFRIATKVATFDALKGEFRRVRYILSGLARENKEIRDTLFLIEEHYQTLLGSAAIPRSILEKMDKILLHISRKSEDIGQFVVLDFAKDYPIAFGKNSQEFTFFVEKCVELQYLEDNGYKTPKPSMTDPRPAFRLGLTGWQRLDEIRRTGRSSNRAFVAMWFADEMKAIYHEGIKPALEDAGYDPVQMFELEHSEKICDRIIAEIRRCGLLIADFTGNRGGVYFEAGFAKGLQVPVIWTCKDEEEHVKGLHFDTRQYNHILWKDAADLRKKLLRRIQAEFPVQMQEGKTAPAGECN